MPDYFWLQKGVSKIDKSNHSRLKKMGYMMWIPTDGNFNLRKEIYGNPHIVS